MAAKNSSLGERLMRGETVRLPEMTEDGKVYGGPTGKKKPRARKTSVLEKATTVAKIEDADARAINEEHRQARQHAGLAVGHAVACGKLLLAKKAKLPHGGFMPWVEANCEFKYSTAARYMKAASESSTGVEISALSYLFPSGRVEAKTTTKATTRTTKKTAVPASATKMVVKDALTAATSVTPPHAAAPTATPADFRPTDIPQAERAAFLAAHQAQRHFDGSDRSADLDRVKDLISQFATLYGWGAAAMDLVSWIEAQHDAAAA